MPTVKLTDSAVQRLKAPSGARIDYFDSALPGLALRVTGPIGNRPERRTWTFFFRYGGKQRRLTFEPGYPALTLAEARQKVNEAKLQLQAGRDPAAEKEAAKKQAKAAAERKPDTIANVVEEFIRRHLEGKKRAPRYIEETRRNFRNHVLPRWAGRDIKTITRRDVIELLDAIMDEGGLGAGNGGKRKRGGPIAANRTLAAITALFNWALSRDIIQATPATRVRKPGEETRRERVLTADELRAIWPQTEALGFPVGSFFQFAMLVGQRREEVAAMRWADLDLNERAWTIPAQSTKSGRGHVVPLAPIAIDILSKLPRLGPYVFTVTGERPISGYSAAKRRLDKAIRAARAEGGLGDIAGWAIHDIRRTVATEMGRLGVPRLVVGRVLNHSDRSVTGIYDRHAYGPEKRHALEAWAQCLGNLVQPPGANVVPLRQAERVPA